MNGRFHNIIRNTEETNAKKLKRILYQLASDMETHSLDKGNNCRIDPYFVVNGLQSCINQDAPIICEIIGEEGIRDGSLQTTQPAFCAEVFFLMLPKLLGQSHFVPHVIMQKRRAGCIICGLSCVSLDWMLWMII